MIFSRDILKCGFRGRLEEDKINRHRFSDRSPFSLEINSACGEYRSSLCLVF